MEASRRTLKYADTARSLTRLLPNPVWSKPELRKLQNYQRDWDTTFFSRTNHPFVVIENRTRRRTRRFSVAIALNMYDEILDSWLGFQRFKILDLDFKIRSSIYDTFHISLHILDYRTQKCLLHLAFINSIFHIHGELMFTEPLIPLKIPLKIPRTGCVFFLFNLCTSVFSLNSKRKNDLLTIL